MEALPTPFHVREPVTFVDNYAALETRINAFPDVEIIGQDATATYNMYAIHLGNRGKPVIFMDAGMHATEWQCIMYSMKFAELLRDRSYPNKKLQSDLLNNFHLIFVPCMNPWGFDRTSEYEPKSTNVGRYTSDGTDLNHDFEAFATTEAQNMKAILDSTTPFAYLNMHMFGDGMSGTGGKHLIIGNGQYSTEDIRDLIADSWMRHSGYEVHRWGGYTNLSGGLSRRYMRDQPNPWTKHTLSYITEMERPIDVEPLSPTQLMEYGISSIELFIRTSIMYYYQKSNHLEYGFQDTDSIDAFTLL